MRNRLRITKKTIRGRYYWKVHPIIFNGLGRIYIPKALTDKTLFEYLKNHPCCKPQIN